MIKRILLAALFGVSSAVFAETLTINVTTEGPREGVIAILIFKEKKGFPNDHEKSFVKGRFPVTPDGEIVCTLTNLPYGAYAASVLHDINENYKSDKHLGFGPPKEPVGVSNRRKKMFRNPKFKDSVFEFSTETDSISIPAFYVL